MAEAEDKQEIRAQEMPEKVQEAPNVNLDELAQGKTEAAQEAPNANLDELAQGKTENAQAVPQDAQEKAEAKLEEKAKQPVQAVGFAPEHSDDTYTVAEEGETLLSIANKLKLSLGELKKRNSVKPLEKLRQHLKIKLPKKK